MDDFMNLLDELSAATEALSGSIKSDYTAISKSASATIRNAKKAIKAGNYNEAAKMCDEAIDEIKAFKVALNSSDRGDARGEEDGAVSGGNKSKFAAAKAIVIAVVSALAAVALIKGGSKLAANKAKAKGGSKKDDPRLMLTGNTKAAVTGKRSPNKLPKTETRLMLTGNTSATEASLKGKGIAREARATLNKVAPSDFAKAAGVAVIGAGVVQALKAFITSKKSSPEAMNKALDASIKSLEAIKAACKEARSDANESVMEEPSTMDEFFNGVFDEIFTDANESFIMDLVECGIDDLTACEMYVDFILPELHAWD